MWQQNKMEHVNQSTLENLKPMELPPLPGNPLVSVLIANYNYAQYIGEAIESVLNQTYQNFEILICDDGSTDNSLEVIRRYAERDSRIKYIAKENGGVASALNECLRIAQGQIGCFLDADDRFKPDKIEAVVKSLSGSTDEGMVIHPLHVINPYGRKVRGLPIPRKLDSGWLAPTVLRNFGSWLCPPASGISFRRDVITKILPIPEELKKNADGYVMFGLPLLTKVVSLPIPLADYRLHGKNVTGLGWARPEVIEYTVTLRLYLRKAVLGKLGIDINFDDEELVRGLAEPIVLYYLQTGRTLPLLTNSAIDMRKPLSFLYGKKRYYIYRALFFLPPRLNLFIIRQWHSNMGLKKISDYIRLILIRLRKGCEIRC
jgi:glycosyltransferase involved in cell wall biosynthesis